MNPHTHKDTYTHTRCARTQSEAALSRTQAGVLRHTITATHLVRQGMTGEAETLLEETASGFGTLFPASRFSLSVSCLYSHVSPSLDDFSHFAVSRDAAASRVQDFSFASSRVMFACTSSLLLLPLLPSSSRCLHFRSS